MLQTFNFHECGAMIQGALSSSAPPSLPPIMSLRMLMAHSAYVSKLQFKTAMTVPNFNSRAVQELFTQPLPKLRELKIRLQVPKSEADGAPFPINISPLLYPKLKKLVLVGVPISAASSLPTLQDLELSCYPPNRAQRLEYFNFTSLLNTAQSLERLVLCSYLWSMWGNPYEPRLKIYLPALKQFVLEDTAPHTTAHVLDWMGKRIPRNTHIAGLHTNASLRHHINSKDPLDHDSLFIKLLGKPQAGDRATHPAPPAVFAEVTEAKLYFAEKCIALVCTGGSPQDPLNLVLKLACSELPTLDPSLRSKLHAMALQSVQRVLFEAYGTLRSLEVVGVPDDVPASAWIELCKTSVAFIPPPAYALRELILTQTPADAANSEGRAAAELCKALCDQRAIRAAYDYPLFVHGLSVLTLRGVRCTKTLAVSLETLSRHRKFEHLNLELVCTTAEDRKCMQEVEVLVQRNAGWKLTEMPCTSG